MKALIHYELDDQIATISMDDGKANVLSVQMMRELNAALDHAQADKAVVVLTGRAGMFSGGFDLAVFKREKEEIFQMLEAGALLAQRLLLFPRPVVAACTGHAVAMGAFLLLCADMRIGADHDVRIQINEVRIGLTVPRFAIELCRQRLAPAHRHRALVSAEPYSPQQALAAGFFDEVVAVESIDAVARHRAKDLLALHADSFSATKLQRNTLDALREAIREDTAEWTTHFRS